MQLKRVFSQTYDKTLNKIKYDMIWNFLAYFLRAVRIFMEIPHCTQVFIGLGQPFPLTVIPSISSRYTFTSETEFALQWNFISWHFSTTLIYIFLICSWTLNTSFISTRKKVFSLLHINIERRWRELRYILQSLIYDYMRLSVIVIWFFFPYQVA